MHVAIDAINANDFIRGPDRYLIELLRKLAELNNGTRYTIFFAPWQHHFRALSLPDNFHFECLNAPRRQATRVLWHAHVFPGIVAKLRPDVLHLPNVIYVRRCGVPVVMTVHDLAHYRYPEKFGIVRSYLLRRLLHKTVSNANFVISVSEYTRWDILHFLSFPAARIRVVLEGGPPIQHQDKSLPSMRGSRYFLYVGQLERTKNVERLVRAFCESRHFEEAGVELWIAGRRGNATEDIQRAIAAYAAEGRVRLLGYVDEERLPQLYMGCEAFVFPSLIEGFGLVLLEAMSYGAPVIAANASVIPEVVGDGAMLVDALDTEDLRAKMEQVYADPALREMLRVRGEARVKSFSWEKAADETWQLYREAAALRHTT